MSRTVLVVGAGGREHALAWALSRSPSVSKVVTCPGNAGTELLGRESGSVEVQNIEGEARDVARALRPDLVVVGPEAPLCAGLVDELAQDGIVCFGPSRAAAELEGSKVFMKRFAERHGLPTARSFDVDAEADVPGIVDRFDTPPVVKADGLCAGKGVVVAESRDEAIAAARGMLRGEAFGDAGSRVVIEERLEGVEVSVHAISDGKRVVLLPAAQDHKRIGDGDRGPNTGGMGTYAPAPWVTQALLERVRQEIVLPAVAGMAAEGREFRGTLFAGLMVSREGNPRLLEFNVRFGDPETQVMLSTLDGDLAELLLSAARGDLSPDAVVAQERHAVCVVLAAAGYPGAVRRGDVISGLTAAQDMDGVRVFHAGTRFDGEEVVTAGGRVLGVTGSGSSLAEARAAAYRGVGAIHFEGQQYRRDIASRALSTDLDALQHER